LCKDNYIFIFVYLSSFYLIEERLFFGCAERLHCRSPPPFGFRVWAFGGGLAAVLCSLMPFFLFFFIFCSRKNGFFSDIQFLYPLSIFAKFDYFLPNIARNLF
jgi:hypothetical protein